MPFRADACKRRLRQSENIRGSCCENLEGYVDRFWQKSVRSSPWPPLARIMKQAFNGYLVCNGLYQLSNFYDAQDKHLRRACIHWRQKLHANFACVEAKDVTSVQWDASKTLRCWRSKLIASPASCPSCKLCCPSHSRSLG